MMNNPVHYKLRIAIACATLALTALTVLAKTTGDGTASVQEMVVQKPHPIPRKIDKPSLRDLYQKAQSGSGEEHYQLGRALLESDGFVTNQDVAVRWLIKAADQGHEEVAALITNLVLEIDNNNRTRETDLALKNCHQAWLTRLCLRQLNQRNEKSKN